MSKPEIVFVFPACMGGVASFNYNIINHSRLIKNFTSKVILLKAQEDERPLFKDRFLVDEVTTFHYSIKENKYRILKRLNNLLGVEKGAIVTDNSLTIEAASLYKNVKTVYSLIHDYYYVNENTHLGDLVDVAIAHSSFFSDAVFASSPRLFAGKSFYIPYGVETQKEFQLKNNAILNLVFLGRLVEDKGVRVLFEINKSLKAKNIPVEWTIIGQGPLKEILIDQWKEHSNVSFHEPESTIAVYELLKKQDIFVLPTLLEGTPVSILECLANGIVPIVNDLPGGIRDIVTKDIGFRCQLNNVAEFVENISMCFADKENLKKMQRACYDLSHRSFNIEKNADNYFLKFLEYEKFQRPNKTSKVKFSKLDKPYFSNELVKLLRSIKARF